MRIYDYGTLLLAINNWAAENPDVMIDSYDMLIDLAERRVESDLDLEIFDSVSETISINAGDSTLNKPSDWGSTRSIYVGNPNTGKYDQVVQRTEEYVFLISQSSFDSIPIYYAELNDEEWLIGPTPDIDYDFRCRFQNRQEGLGIQNTSTWMSRHCGDLLFAGCMIEVSTLLRFDEGKHDRFMSRYYKELLPPKKRELKSLMRKDYTPISRAPEPDKDEANG